jgi:hypothetical protein
MDTSIVGSRDVLKNTGRLDGGMVCIAISMKCNREVIYIERTENRDHRSSVVESDGQAREKSYNDIGGFAGATALCTVAAGRFEPLLATVTGVSSAIVVDRPLVGNIVLSPDARKIPPPTRLCLVLSRAFLASLNVRDCSGEGVGLEFIVVVRGEGEGVEDAEVGDCLSEREERGLRASFANVESRESSIVPGTGGTGASVVAPFG